MPGYDELQYGCCESVGGISIGHIRERRKTLVLVVLLFPSRLMVMGNLFHPESNVA